jgi:hypothetical protein
VQPRIDFCLRVRVHTEKANRRDLPNAAVSPNLKFISPQM